MHIIDRYAYHSRLRALEPKHKAVLALLVMVLCLALDRPAVGLLAAGCMWGLASFWAGVPVMVFGRLLLAQGLFLLLAVSSVAVNLSTAPQEGSLWSASLGPLWLGSNPTSVDTAARLATRALGCAAAMNFLALTTPLVDLIDLMRRSRLPLPLIDLMTLVYRFIFTLLDRLNQMHTAQDSRLGYVNLRRGMASAGVLAARLFVEAYRHSQRLQTALESRGYHGDLKVLPSRHRTDWRFCCLGVIILASLSAARMLS
ncbi:MAG: cobalt ECF transporter T component CbiQ [Chloroflexota bacterium]